VETGEETRRKLQRELDGTLQRERQKEEEKERVERQRERLREEIEDMTLALQRERQNCTALEKRQKKFDQVLRRSRKVPIRIAEAAFPPWGLYPGTRNLWRNQGLNQVLRTYFTPPFPIIMDFHFV